MVEVVSTILKEVSKDKLNNVSFDEVNKRMSPRELMSKSGNIGLVGSYSEMVGIKSEIFHEITIKRFLPKEGGEWEGEIGDSTWKPDRNEIPKRPPGNESTWGEILDKYEIDGIEFKDGEPDFSTVSEGTVEIDDFSTDRNGNFTQADEQLAEKWTSEGKDGREWSPQDIKEYRKENNLSWHERSDMQTIDLVPQEVHGNVPHSGGISASKNKNN